MLTHGMGALLSVASLPIMINAAHSSDAFGAVTSASIFGSSLILLYTISALYHFFSHPGTKIVFQRFDHICIYLLIAGTYTPFTLSVIGGSLGWTLFGIVWGMAILGITFKAIFGPRYDLASSILYVCMGWMVLFGIQTVVSNMPTTAFILLAAGGAAYTLGVPFYLKDTKKKWFHGIWHCFVLAGSALHVLAILSFYKYTSTIL